MVQPDFKKLIAYSSVSHLGFVMLGLWALTLESTQGALLVMINHGISTGALFFLVGMVYERRHSRMIADFGGIARVMPAFAAILTFVSLSSIGLPGTNGFVGEFLVLLGAFQTHPVAAAVSTTAVIAAAAYLLWALKRVLYGPLEREENRSLGDLTRRELAVLVPLVALIVWLGLYPQPVLRRLEPSARAYIETVHTRLRLMTPEAAPTNGE
jgi:NADH-quinone oxidoreductase subunit M